MFGELQGRCWAAGAAVRRAQGEDPGINGRPQTPATRGGAQTVRPLSRHVRCFLKTAVAACVLAPGWLEWV